MKRGDGVTELSQVTEVTKLTKVFFLEFQGGERPKILWLFDDMTLLNTSELVSLRASQSQGGW